MTVDGEQPVRSSDADQLAARREAVSRLSCPGSAELRNRTLRRPQSEFLAIGSTAVFGNHLRQRGSPESRPVGAPPVATDETG